MRPATELAAAVRRGDLSAPDAVAESLARIAAADPRVGAFELVRSDAAPAEAAALQARPDLGDLPLAGVPVAVKDNVDVAGEPTRHGSAVTPAGPAPADHVLVERLRAAGAVVVGKTRLPELAVWATTDTATGITRNPWDLRSSPGGSSGGSAAAVAAGMVPAALASDGMGSIRIPAAACGLVGLKPGPGLVPGGEGHWFGQTEFGALTTTVADTALLLDVLAGTQRFRDPAPPQRPLRITWSLRAPVPGVRLAQPVRAAVRALAMTLRTAGHDVRRDDPPYRARVAPQVLARWTAGVEREATERGITWRMEARNRRHAQAGRAAQRAFKLTEDVRERWVRVFAAWFATRDVLITPVLAHCPLPAVAWRDRSWVANVWSCANLAPYPPLWNFLRFPAMSVPAGRDEHGHPIGAQLVGPPGSEAVLLALAAHVEQLAPWPRLAPAPA